MNQIRVAIVEVVKAGSPFAIRGGGHSSNAIGSSTNGGFLFDLSALDHVIIAEDQHSVKLGPGVHWGDLYQKLEKQGLMCAGGRDFGVGVPGFIFGGGLSFYSSRVGWGVDTLLSADIILADGELITASSSSHPELFKALHGGGAHNFGIVVNLTLKLYPYSGFWGGMNIVAEEHFESMFQAYDTYTNDLRCEDKSHMIMDFARHEGAMIVCHTMAYTEPRSDPPIFDGLRKLPQILNTCRLTDISDLANEVAVTTDCRGKRNMYWTHTLHYDIDVLKAVYDLWAKRSQRHKHEFRSAMSVNHMPWAIRNGGTREGNPNVYGLEGDGILLNILLTATWDRAEDDDHVTSQLREWTQEAQALERQQGKDHVFKYMNYSHAEQDVVGGFGPVNQAFLHDVSRKYDRDGVFQKLQPGGFKLGLKVLQETHAML